jgi:hypothetical protein
VRGSVTYFITTQPNRCKVHVAKRENPIVNRLNKTKIEKDVDHEQEKVDRLKAESAIRRQQAAEKVRFSSYISLSLFLMASTEKGGC